ncbi:MAG: HupE/UreJ family protein [Opitutaceae bacterium]
MTSRLRSSRLIPVLFFATACLAEAHPGHGPASLSTGFIHPLTGWDHLAAMVAVGLWAAQIGGRAKWALPVAFVGSMVLGAAAGVAGLAPGGAEWGILASVFILGTVIAAAIRPPVWAAVTVAAVAGTCHGIAHGAEMPANSNTVLFLVGMIIATALLHALGVAAGSYAAGRRSTWLRVAGAAVVAIGFGLLLT